MADINKLNRQDRDNAAYKQSSHTPGAIDRRTCDEGANDKLNTIIDLLDVDGSGAGNPFFASGSDVTDQSAKTLVDVTVPVATTRNITKVVVTTKTSGKFEIKIDGVVVGSGRTGPGQPNVEFTFLPYRGASAGQQITIEHTSASGPPSDVEAYLMATDLT